MFLGTLSKHKGNTKGAGTPHRCPEQRTASPLFIFFHPDCTVGFGLSPNHALETGSSAPAGLSGYYPHRPLRTNATAVSFSSWAVPPVGNFTLP